MNAQQMQELCRELVVALKRCDPGQDWTIPDNVTDGAVFCEISVGDIKRIRSAVAKAETALNPTPAPTGCVETAATVSATAPTGEMVKALGVGPVDACPVCGRKKKYKWETLACHIATDDPDCPGLVCMHGHNLAITRSKQLAEAENALRYILDLGGMDANDGNWCSDVARRYFRSKLKEPTA